MNSICFFCSYFNESAIPYYIKFYLENLTPYFDEIIFITNEKQLDIESNNFLVEKNIKLNYVVNEGWDFGMWYKAFKLYDIKDYERIGLVNDSCILFRKPDEFFDWLDKVDYDYCGMVDSNAVSYHLQSFFLIINKKSVPDVFDYFMQQGIVKDVKDVIRIYEIGLSKYLLQKGYKLGACYSISDYFGEYSPTYFLSDKLIAKGLPLIKKKIISCSYRKDELFTLARMNFNIQPNNHIEIIKKYNNDNSIINFEKVKSDFKIEMSLYDKISYNLKRNLIRLLRPFYKITLPKRIVNKGFYLIDLLLSKMTDILFYIKIFRKIPFNKISGSEPEFKTEHIYPINYNPVDKKLFEHSKKYSTISDEIFVLKNASVTNSGIVTNGFKMFIPALPHPIFRISFGFRYILKQKIFYSSRRLDDKKKYVLIFDLWSKNNYYHWVIDSLSRLYNIKKKMTDFIVLLPEKSPGFINETLALFDIKNIEYIGEKEFIKVPDLYIQNYTAGSGRQNPLAVNRVREFVLNRVNTGIGKKFIYVSRANQKTRRVNNENEIIAIVKEYGFEIVFFENINFEDQVSLMRNVKCLITSHGANLTNILFMPKGAKVFELIRADKPNFCYWSLASSIGINYYYQLCSICNKDHLIVDTKQFIDNINSLLKG